MNVQELEAVVADLQGATKSILKALDSVNMTLKVHTASIRKLETKLSHLDETVDKRTSIMDVRFGL